jgi:1-acyl-sn-glycerol-3-phosphate acyltransferase
VSDKPGAALIPPPPTATAMARAHTFLAPWRAVTRPVFTGLEHLPQEGPVLLVGNHSTYGALDVPLLLDHVYQQRRICIRTLGDRMHDMIPVWRDVLRSLGAVAASQANARALLSDGRHVLVFPGGAREVNKRRGQQYQLLWDGRLGFARLAQQLACPIVPIASVGADDLYDIVIDADTPALKPLQNLIKRRVRRDDIFTPIGFGIGPTFIPKPRQFFFSFGAPIDATIYTADQVPSLRDAVKSSLETQIAALLTLRDES